jgi:CRP-like cAMP-binding protein
MELSFEEALGRWARRLRLSREELQPLRDVPHTLQAFNRDDFIVREGTRPTTCAIIVAGSAFRLKVVNHGARQIMAFHFPGEFIDLQNCLLSVNDHSVQAMTACRVAVFPKQAVASLVESSPNLTRALWLDTLIEAAIFREWVVNVGRRNARARIAHLLCELAVRLEEFSRGEKVYQMPITQEQIADATGMTSVHTNRTIQSLRREGLISLSAGRLVVHDWPALKSIGDFSDLYLHNYADAHASA